MNISIRDSFGYGVYADFKENLQPSKHKAYVVNKLLTPRPFSDLRRTRTSPESIIVTCNVEPEMKGTSIKVNEIRFKIEGKRFTCNTIDPCTPTPTSTTCYEKWSLWSWLLFWKEEED